MHKLTIKRTNTSIALKEAENCNQYLSSDKYENQTYTQGENGEILKKERSFLDFYIDGKPLWRIIDEFCSHKTPLIYNWTGFLESNTPEVNAIFDRILIKLLKCQNITIDELELVFPRIAEIDRLISIQEEYTQSNSRDVLIYGCRECVDYDCGGIGIKVIKNDDSYIWAIENQQGETKRFNFEKEMYLEALNKYKTTANKV